MINIIEVLKRLRKSYRCGYTIGIIESYDKLIAFVDVPGYPVDIQKKVHQFVEQLIELRTRADKKQFDNADEELRKFNSIANEFAFRVLVPWLNEGQNIPFIWTNGGTA